MQCSSGNLPGKHASWIMMTAESRTENPTFCCLNQHWLPALQTKSSAGWHLYAHSLPPLQTWLALYRGSHQSMQAGQEMLTVGMLLPSITYQLGEGQASQFLWRAYACVFHFRDQDLQLRTSTAWGDGQSGPACGKNKQLNLLPCLVHFLLVTEGRK